MFPFVSVVPIEEGTRLLDSREDEVAVAPHTKRLNGRWCAPKQRVQVVSGALIMVRK
jgi:hypothetical protein